MVTTRSDKVAFALGETNLRGKRMLSQEYVEIIRTLIKITEPKYARGFTSLHNILSGKRNSLDDRKLGQTESAVVTAALDDRGLPASALFINLCLVEDSTADSLVMRRPHGEKERVQVFAPVRTSRLLLSRKGEIWLMRVVWKAFWADDDDIGHKVTRVVDKVTLEVLSDEALSQIFASHPKQRAHEVSLGERVILALYRVQYLTSDEMKGAARSSERRTRKIAKVVERLGFGIIRGQDE